MHVLSGTVFCQGMDGLLRGLKHCSLLRDLILSTKLICMLMGPYTLYGDVHRVLYRVDVYSARLYGAQLLSLLSKYACLLNSYLTYFKHIFVRDFYKSPTFFYP